MDKVGKKWKSKLEYIKQFPQILNLPLSKLFVIIKIKKIISINALDSTFIF
jgi:hypothetical protein